MATVPGTIVSVHGITAPHGPAKDSSGNELQSCFVQATFTGTYASGDDATISNAHTAIANELRNGKTVTLVDACFAAPGKTSAGVVVGGNTGSIDSTTNIKLQLTQADLATEVSNGAITVSEPLSIFVTYKLS